LWIAFRISDARRYERKSGDGEDAAGLLSAAKAAADAIAPLSIERREVSSMSVSSAKARIPRVSASSNA